MAEANEFGSIRFKANENSSFDSIRYKATEINGIEADCHTIIACGERRRIS